jgi:hypothetical protein
MRDHQDEWRTAVHEAGHAVAAALGNVPIRSVTAIGGQGNRGARILRRPASLLAATNPTSYVSRAGRIGATGVEDPANAP